MNPFLKLTFVAITLALITQSAKAADPVYQESDGFVVIEAESQPTPGDWKFESGGGKAFTPGFTGDGYIWYDGPDHFGGAPTGETISYVLKITNPGTYRLQLRTLKDTDARDLANDVWSRMLNYDGWQGTFAKTRQNEEVRQWNWHTRVDPVGGSYWARYNLVAGEYTFQIAPRSRDYYLDRLVFYNESMHTFEEATVTTLPLSGFTGEVIHQDTTTTDTTTVVDTTIVDTSSVDTTAITDPAKGDTITMKAIDFPIAGTDFYIHASKGWLAINPSNASNATTSMPFAGGTGKYDVIFHGVGESDGQSKFKLWIDDSLIGDFQLAEGNPAVPFQTGIAYNHTFPGIEISAGADIKVYAEINSSDGKEYSRARWESIEFIGYGSATNVKGPGTRTTGISKIYPLANRLISIYSLNGRLITQSLSQSGKLPTGIVPTGLYLVERSGTIRQELLR